MLTSCLLVTEAPSLKTQTYHFLLSQRSWRDTGGNDHYHVT